MSRGKEVAFKVTGFLFVSPGEDTGPFPGTAEGLHAAATAYQLMSADQLGKYGDQLLVGELRMQLVHEPTGYETQAIISVQGAEPGKELFLTIPAVRTNQPDVCPVLTNEKNEGDKYC